MYVIIVHVITVHSLMLYYPIIINFSNIKENTPTYHSQAHAHTCTHAHVHADLYHNLNKTEALSFSQHWDIISLSATIATMTLKLMRIFIYYRGFLNMQQYYTNKAIRDGRPRPRHQVGWDIVRRECACQIS